MNENNGKSALGLPPGSVRAIGFWAILGATIAMLTLKIEIPGEWWAIVGSGVGLYFGKGK